MVAPLVTAYSSDSEDDAAEVASGRVAATQVQEKTSSRSVVEGIRGSGLKLPPPSAQSRQVRQIHIESMDAEPAPSTSPLGGSVETLKNGTQHSLFGMLPAPRSNRSTSTKQTEQRHESENRVEDDTRLTIVSDAADQKPRDNDDFRRMLGLAPKPKSTSQSKPPVVIASESVITPHNDIPTDSDANATKPRIQSRMEKKSESDSREHRSFHVSAAPDVKDKPTSQTQGKTSRSDQSSTEDWSGWRQDPDGSWYPVTPEAHAAYAAWAAQAEAEAQAAATYASKSDKQQDVGRMATFDANAELSNSRPIQPTEPASKKPKVEWNISEKLQSERLTNMRARNRGQLSSLLVQAADTREILEERWAKGKTKRREASKRYGF
ncbi:hypothetical protein MYAM1_000440 [Malassezia yamatoensis]|uniref:Mitotic checkpoint regulator, MAD2B-interacting-domain-containing protein n=1 Tax=Malassezia yamatoensis TaxID=253288 RepID=A0AAJ6CHD4_9BASI|nr:hypothetical protein MYAM1_000440 [Malassezia yamatoensis]